jgi:hypothetical protein
MKHLMKKFFSVTALGLILSSGFAINHPAAAFAEDQQADWSTMDQQEQGSGLSDGESMDMGDGQDSYDDLSSGDEPQAEMDTPQEDIPASDK